MVVVAAATTAYYSFSLRMVKRDIETEGRFLRPLLVVGSGVLAVAVAIALNVILTDRPPAPVQQAPGTVTPAPTPATPPMAAKPAEPAFDVVRVEPSGAAVIAGRGTPGARIAIRSGETVVGEGTADDRGEWVVVPAQPLAPGTHELTVEQHEKDGAVKTADDMVVVVVPPPPAAGAIAGSGPLAVKTSRSATTPSTVLQSGGGEQAGPLAIETVDSSGDGRIIIGGRAVPQSRIRVYLDNAFLGETTADSLGLWRLTPEKPVAPGEHSLRADQVTERGEVVARARVPLRLTGSVAVINKQHPHGGVLVIERGDSLWRIARAVYGEGPAYTLIYDANRHQIDDPNLIYPGQVFQIPKAQ